jgi:restriction system protein
VYIPCVRAINGGDLFVMSVKSAIKGWFGEVQGTLAKKLFLDADTYIDINNVTIPAANGTTQIDHIIVSRFGIFVIETKNIDGWIYGDEKSPQWTQNLFGKKFNFQNPLHQNYRHTRALSDFLGIEHEKFFSVVMFWGECQFKTPMPANVMDRGYTGYIKSKSQVLFSEAEVAEIVTAIKTRMLPKSWKTRREHVQKLDQRFSSTTVCPKCGAALVLRTAKTGKTAGNQFYGCSGFPQCRYVRSVQP